MRVRIWFLRPLAAPAVAVAVLLAACSGSQLAGVGGEGTGRMTVAGRVDGFASTIIEGRAYADEAARVYAADQDGAQVAAPLTRIELGARVLARFEVDSGGPARLLEADTAPALLGPLQADAVEDRRFVVLGQPVVIDGHPALHTVSEAASDLLAGDMVEVHGLRTAGGELIATRVRRRAPDLPVVAIRGTVTAVDPAAGSFAIGALTVRTESASLEPAGAVIAVGDRVAVGGSRSALAGNRLTAATVRRLDPLGPAGSAIRWSGLVTRIDPPGVLEVDGVPIDAAEARVQGAPSAAAVPLDAFVRVEGLIERHAGRDRVVASELEMVPDAAAAAIDVTGPVSDFSGADQVFRLRGATVRIDAATTFVDGDPGSLANGVPVRVAGRIVAGELRAQQVRWIRPAAAVAGTILGYDPVAGSFGLSHLDGPVRILPSTRVDNGTLADLADGVRVRVIGRATPTGFEAREIARLDAVGAPLVVTLAGVASDPQPGSTIFVHDTQVGIGAQTRVTGGPTGTLDDLDGGQFLLVRAVRQGGALLATEIQIRIAADDDLGRVIGYVHDLAGPASFRVAGQRVDASAATIVGGPDALAELDLVLVEGRIVDGILQAARIEHLPD